MSVLAVRAAPDHDHEWGSIDVWEPSSSRIQRVPSLRVPYRECDVAGCPEQIWGDDVNSAEVLDHLATRALPPTSVGRPQEVTR